MGKGLPERSDKLKIPPTIQIGGITYRVVFMDKPFFNDEGNEMVARILFTESLIQISGTKMGEQMVDVSFLHELKHGIFYCMGIVGKEASAVLDERFVEQCAHLWNQVIQQILDYNLIEAGK